MSKTPKNYRLSDEAQSSIANIKARYNCASDTAAIEMALRFLDLELLPLKIVDDRIAATRPNKRAGKKGKK